MTHTDEGSRGNPSILAIGTLALHRETLEHLTGGAVRRSPRRDSGATSGSFPPVPTLNTCRGRTCNRKCPTATCGCSIF